MARVAGWRYISPSMAGATMTGAAVARQVAVMASPARPLAMAASQWAVAGATRMASAASAATMCAMRSSGSSSSGSCSTWRRVSAASVSGPRKCVALGVMAACTSAPAAWSARASSAAL